jgi:hypothetical protein
MMTARKTADKTPRATKLNLATKRLLEKEITHRREPELMTKLSTRLIEEIVIQFEVKRVELERMKTELIQEVNETRKNFEGGLLTEVEVVDYLVGNYNRISHIGTAVFNK